jgi:hypothetical protein
MTAVPTCPRCGSLVQEARLAGATPAAWYCMVHGEVWPLRAEPAPSADALRALARGAAVPVWLPWPMPTGWLVTGFARAGGDHGGTRGCAVNLSGPNPLGGPGEMLLVSEEPGIGLGARFAGLDGPDPGGDIAAGPPQGVVRSGHHDFALWQVDQPGRAAFVGEAMGAWLWVILWPATAGVLLAEQLELTDLRDPWLNLDLPFGAPSPLLRG